MTLGSSPEIDVFWIVAALVVAAGSITGIVCCILAVADGRRRVF
jgi:hypothetical protein